VFRFFCGGCELSCGGFLFFIFFLMGIPLGVVAMVLLAAPFFFKERFFFFCYLLLHECVAFFPSRSPPPPRMPDRGSRRRRRSPVLDFLFLTFQSISFSSSAFSGFLIFVLLW